MPPTMVIGPNGTLNQPDTAALNDYYRSQALQQQTRIRRGDQSNNRAYSERMISDPVQSGAGLEQRQIVYDTDGNARITWGRSLEDITNDYYRAFGGGATGNAAGDIAPYVPPPAPSWSDSRAALDAAYGRAKETVARNTRNSLGALRNYAASTNRLGSGMEMRAAGRIAQRGADQISDVTRDNEIGVAVQQNDFSRRQYDANRQEAGKEFDSRYNIWNAKNRNAIDAANANRESIMQLYRTTY